MLRTTLSALLVLPLLALAPRAAPAGDALAWRLGRSDFLRYERTRRVPSDDGEKLVDTTLVSVHGHDLGEDGQYAPASAVLDDLFQVLAFRLPAAGEPAAPVKLDWAARRLGTVRIKGTLTVLETEADRVTVEGRFTFASRGKVPREARWWLDGGSATSRITFDAGRGLVQHARLDVAYARENLKQNGPGAVVDRKESYTYELKAVEPRRGPDFQARVHAAIEKGVKHLRAKQREDGSWPPHAKYRLGTTALTVLTLLACEVPATDPAVARPLDWIFTQDPERTYEQATCLMAIDRAYTPPGELEALRTGKVVRSRERKLPADRMAWVRRIAERLERAATGGGGSWGYPSPSTSALRFDTSNTQYAVLGLRAASHLGYATDERTWLGVIRHAKEVRERKGPRGSVSLVREGMAIPDEETCDCVGVVKVPQVSGFAYSTVEGHDHVSASMTCAGISLLRIARHQLLAMESRKFRGKLVKEVEDMLLGGWAWLDRHWAMDRNAMHPQHDWYWYFLYSLERAAVLSDVKRVGGRDWYYEGAIQLIHRQAEDGGWNDPGKDEITPTCFALLFLRRGTTPLGQPLTGKDR